MSKYDEFLEKREALKTGGKAEKRLQLLFDGGAYEEDDPWLRNSCLDFDLYKRDVRNEGVIACHGKIAGRDVFAYSHDFTIMGGSMGQAQGEKICRLIDSAMKTGHPIVGLIEASGARIQEGVAALHGYCSVFGRTSIASGWIPHISVIMGTVAGGTAYAAALTDFIVMIRNGGNMFITGPAVIKSVTGEDVSFEQIGGPQVHGSKTGTAHFVVNSEEEAIELVQRLLSFLPANSKMDPPRFPSSDPFDRKTPELRDLVIENPMKNYDIKSVISCIADGGDFLEIQEGFAKSIVIAFARLGGRTVGIVGNQPKVLAGCIDINASWKAGRFVRFCDCFNIPLITLADCPGYLPGVDQEHGGIIRNGAKLLFAYSESTVPKITVVLRKDYGGAYSAMCGKGMGADLVFAFPAAELAVMGAEGAAAIVFKKEIETAKSKGETKRRMIDDYNERYLNPYRGAEYGIVNDIIDPADLRARLISNLELLRNKELSGPYKKHSNIPL